MANKESDIPTDNWLVKHTPKNWHPFIRLARFDRPIGTWLLLFPCWWSLSMATHNFLLVHEIIYLFTIFGIGALIMRGAGCTYNDIIDRNFDSKVSRTKSRPLPSGEVTLNKAICFLGVLIIIGFLILSTLNDNAILVGVLSLILVFTYPFMKRVTFWPQLFLGLTFNWGALLAWAAVKEEISFTAVLLYLGGVFWTLGYDTIYAHQDRIDDPDAGIKSTARFLGPGSKPWLYLFYLVALILFICAGLTLGISWPFYFGLTFGALQLLWQVWDLDLNSPKDCLAKFKSNRLFSWLFLGGILASHF
ncbi:MAG: 4-hydroxybenzoate octaprenyltransferase [Rhodospirillaceae bacterium]|nr:4-hydroxybenzoate octaprenyltransferase [Rhodospirillaceae bacterium]